MSRRAPNPAAERAAQNQATIKNLLKLEPNKICADCKRNKHPRWASWNLGVFVCIRCSGIHRGMGTHISRVKSVDLDSWTDEQLQSVLSWGNARANKYWEAKLAAGHVPSESKIENFIRTKYELKRWAMEGPIPNPATLDVDGDDDVPLSLVKEKQTIDRNESIRKTSVGQQSAPRNVSGPQADLIGGIDTPPRASTAGPPATNKVPPKAEPAPPKSTSTKESLLGLDFLGEPSAPPRPASTTGVSAPSGQSRPDLKQSILSLYASAPRQPPQQPQQPQQPAQHQQQGSFGSFGGSPTIGHHQQGSAGGFSDAFSSLSLGNTTSPKPAATDPFASLGGSSGTRRPAQPANNNSFGGLGSGSFFNSKPAQPVAPAHQKQPSSGGFGDFGDFSSPTSPPISQSKPPQPSSSAMGDLFDLSSPAPTTQTISSPPPMASPPASSSVFNLSAPQNPPAQAQQQRPAQATTAVPSAFGGSGISGADVWGGSAWATPDTTTAAAPAANNSAPAQAAPANDFGWGSSGGFGTPAPAPVAAPAPKVAADEEFGGWTSSTGGQSTSTGSKPVGGGFGGDEDLFSNVWG